MGVKSVLRIKPREGCGLGFPCQDSINGKSRIVLATNETICVALSERWRYPLSFLRLYRRVPQPGLQPRAAGKFAQYVAIKCSEYLTEAGIEPSVGSIGDADGNPLTETVNGLYKPDVIQRCGSGDVPSHVANGRALLIDDYAALSVPARSPSLLAIAECVA